MTTQAQPLNVNQIEKDLKSLWGKAGQGHGIDASVSRACLSNLIIYTEDTKDAEAVTGTIAEFVSKHPCRTILIIANPKSHESGLNAEATTHTYNTSGGRRNVSCEQITLHVSGASVKDLASVVQPLLVPDLPVYLWWRGVFLTQRTLSEQMIAFADRFIYDGVSWTDLHYTVPQVAEYFDRYKDTVGFTNFNWSRLRPWRELAADFFDTGMFENEVWDINRIRVEYMSLAGLEEGYQFRALLFASWMAVQLEWEPVQGKSDSSTALIQFKNKKGKKVEAELALIPQTSTTGQSIQKIIMSIQREANSQDFIIQRDNADHVMILTCKNQDKCSILRKVPHVDSSPAELLFRELGRRVRNRVFEKSFKMAAKLIQMI